MAVDTMTASEAPAIDVALDEAEQANVPALNDELRGKIGSMKEEFEKLRTDLEARATEFSSQLPPSMPKEKFLTAALAAARNEPKIMLAERRSVFIALIMAAQDGLLPDGREGVITLFNTKGVIIAQWNPMIYGLRKRARELDGIIIDAQVVYEADDFAVEFGDNPRITHHLKFGKDRGAGIGAYAVFHHPGQGILHREVMSRDEIDATKAQSRAKNSLMWTRFWTEGWRKTVARRGIKTVPVSYDLMRIATRDDAFTDLDALPSQPQTEIGARLKHGHRPAVVYAQRQPIPASSPVETKEPQMAQSSTEGAQSSTDATAGQADTISRKVTRNMFEEATLAELESDLSEVATQIAVKVIAEEFEATIEHMTPDGAERARAMITARMEEVK